jgi:hypothetical protein
MVVEEIVIYIIISKSKYLFIVMVKTDIAKSLCIIYTKYNTKYNNYIQNKYNNYIQNKYNNYIQNKEIINRNNYLKLRQDFIDCTNKDKINDFNKCNEIINKIVNNSIN